jgi:formylglycine-generating enzyme
MRTIHRFAILLVTLIANIFSDRAWSDTFGSGPDTFNIDFVTIGNPANAADTAGSPNPAGSVPYVYRMGTYEISRDMITKANNLGNLAITLQNMTSYGGNGADRPATGVSWNEAARFVNWLNTSTGSAPAYKFALQPGEVGYSANANIQLWDPLDAGYNPANLYRNSLARYFLPSAHEWYKAAYYSPASGIYYLYPTGSDSAPTPVASGTTAGTAVYYQNRAIGPADITLASGLSPYGTMGQGGNVDELDESSADLLNNSSSSIRGLRGGDWFADSDYLRATWRNDDDGPSGGSYHIGFRVASIPEPSTTFLGALGVVAVLWWRRRRS